jgi:DNA-directed RNA polymerase subunit RPC12/RpoP
MPARTSRQEAREAAKKAFEMALDRMIPADESKPLKGGKFIDWENQVEQMAQAVLPTVLEQRALLEESAQVEQAGRCPHCGSDRTYLEKQSTQPEIISPHGPVVIEKQHARCHCCGGSFSPSGS